MTGGVCYAAMEHSIYYLVLILHIN